jgi:RHH-type transcriptional regulator, rel operon repressor / antitoxin RelB
VKRTAENKLKVVAVRVDPQIEQRLRLLAEVTGRKQSFFLQQMIESGIGAMENTWLPQDVLSQVRSGRLRSRQPANDATSDLFGDSYTNHTNEEHGSVEDAGQRPR